MFRRASMLLCLLLSLLVAVPASAQRNPFADEEEKEDEEAKPVEKKKTDKKKSDKDKKKTGKTNKADKKEDKEPAEDEEATEEEAALEAAEAEKAAAEQAAAEQAQQEAEAAAARAEAERLLGEEEAEEEEEEVDEDYARGGRVGLSENFSQAELITTAAVLPIGLTLAIGGPTLFGEPSASMTAPRLGSLDYRLSVASHGDLLEGSPFAFGVFDIAGIAYPAALGAFYAISGVYLWAADAPLFGAQTVNIDHSMLAMAETVGWAALTSGVVHLLIGREKPYAAFNRTAYGEPEEVGANLSFMSTTTTLSFAMSSFAARDYADSAMRRGQNVVTGAILPYALLYGMSTMIGYSAIYGQQHYFSDIAISALIGGLIGNLSYVAHFDAEGRPRRDRRELSSSFGPTLVSHPDARTSMGVGFSGKF